MDGWESCDFALGGDLLAGDENKDGYWVIRWSRDFQTKKAMEEKKEGKEGKTGGKGGNRKLQK